MIRDTGALLIHVWFVFKLEHASGPNSTIAIPDAKSTIINEEDLRNYSFAKYAATYFEAHQTHQYSRRQLKSALLQTDRPHDQIAAQVNTYLKQFKSTRFVNEFVFT